MRIRWLDEEQCSPTALREIAYSDKVLA